MYSTYSLCKKKSFGEKYLHFSVLFCNDRNNMKYISRPTGFTLVEIIVAATILVILTSIGFYAYTNNIADARDGVRKTDIASLESALNLYKREK